LLFLAADALAQNGTPAQLAPGQDCAFVTQAHATESAGTPNVNHDGSPLPGIPAPDISRGFQGIPRSAQPPLTASQQRILECRYRLAEADADMPYALFIPSRHLYLEFPGKDHEFWIRRGAENMEKVFLFFATVSKRTHTE
jgi:hypothetical protein